MIGEEESRLLEKAERDVLLYRIFSGKLLFEDSYIREPTLRIKEIGQQVFYEVLRDCADVPTDRDLCAFLINSGQWSFEEQRRLDSLPKQIEDSKVELFQNYDNPARRKEIKIVLDHKKAAYVELLGKRNFYYKLSQQGIASGAMWHKMIELMYKGPNKLGAISFYHGNSIPENTIRSIVLNSDFSTYYGASRNIFGKPAIKLTDDQRKLMVWANIYKNVRNNPDCPPDIIMNDHDGLDGWFLVENRKAKSTKKVAGAKGISPNAKNVYFSAKNKDEYDEIMSMNDRAALSKIEKEFRGSEANGK